MGTTKFLFVSLALLLVCSGAQAQFGKRLGNAVENAAKNAVVRKAEQKTDAAVDKSIDKVTDPGTYKEKDGKETEGSEGVPVTQSSSQTGVDDNEGGAPLPSSNSAQSAKAVEMTYAKSDFVPGDEIIFEDNLANEQMGEFPSQWDLVEGSAEVASIDGAKAIYLDGTAPIVITPLMKNMKNYLPDVYTLELDFWMNKKDVDSKKNQAYTIYFFKEDVKYGHSNEAAYRLRLSADHKRGGLTWNYKTPDGEQRDGAGSFAAGEGEWHHLAVSFNKRALKVYIDGIRVGNIPNVMGAANFRIYGERWNDGMNFEEYIANVRIAKGAVPLYDRLTTDGKIITYGITFDAGKSAIKPESMTEINRIALLMNEKPDLKFSVEGHTDTTGNAASNQTLSDARSKAVADKLIEMGVAANRLQSAGKGQNSPIADNSTDEGRAKNRRVEFVTIN